jgi:hypothetical protein
MSIKPSDLFSGLVSSGSNKRKWDQYWDNYCLFDISHNHLSQIQVAECHVYDVSEAPSGSFGSLELPISQSYPVGFITGRNISANHSLSLAREDWIPEVHLTRSKSLPITIHTNAFGTMSKSSSINSPFIYVAIPDTDSVSPPKHMSFNEYYQTIYTPTLPSDSFRRVIERGMVRYKFTWENCTHSFTRRSGNRAHWFKHQQILPFICTYCAVKNRRMNGLNRHFALTHEKVDSDSQ